MEPQGRYNMIQSFYIQSRYITKFAPTHKLPRDFPDFVSRFKWRHQGNEWKILIVIAGETWQKISPSLCSFYCSCWYKTIYRHRDEQIQHPYIQYVIEDLPSTNQKQTWRYMNRVYSSSGILQSIIIQNFTEGIQNIRVWNWFLDEASEQKYRRLLV